MMRFLYCLPLLLTLCLANDSKVLVHIPFPIHNASGFDHVKAEFGFDGITSAGRSLAEYVYYLEETLCYPVTNMTKGYPAHDGLRKTPFILLINGGGVCSAVTKVRHAQHIGASAVLLAAPHCLCQDTSCTAKYPNETCESVDPVLVNDGSGRDISIPSFLIYKELGEALKGELKKNQPCLLELQWGLLDTTIGHSPPKLRFWTTAYDPLVRLETYVELRTVLTAFNKVAVFSPRYRILDGSRFGCDKDTDTANGPCDHLCTNHGRYCTLHAVNLSGNAIVKETLRRLCIWKHYGVNADMYWDYVIYHKQECSRAPESFADVPCIDAAYRAAKIDASTVQQCMVDAGSVDADTTNALLDEAVKDHGRSGVVTLPALTVNHQVLSYTSARSLFDTVCTEYWLSNVDQIPSICEACSACPNIIGCVEQNGKCVGFSNDQRHPATGFSDNSKKGRGWKFFWSLAFMGIAAGAAWYYYDQNIRGNRRAGTSLMNDYLHLSGEE